MPDATIIGAGPAGTIAALLLARTKWRITLIEQHRFPRDKVCGECLSALGMKILHRTALAQNISTLKPTALRWAALVSPDGKQSKLKLPQPMWGITRRALDAALLDEAIRAGVFVEQPARSERIDSGPRVTVRDLVTNEVTTRTPSHLLIADGKSSGLTGDMGFKAHFTNVDDVADTITLFGLKGHYVGLAPVEGGSWNLAMSLPAAKMKHFHGDGDRLFAQLLDENVGLRRRMRDAKRVGDWLASPLPRFAVKRDWPRGVIPIGNAAAALEPIGGEGMGLAMRSAELVANELIAAEREGRPYRPTRLNGQMRRLWTVRSAACRVGGVMLSSPTAARWMRRVARPLAPLALKLVGK
jgi:2-polyprenyl-6-methoxyphenol hydroxylase-like FAD-dependent oxidoreductase